MKVVTTSLIALGATLWLCPPAQAGMAAARNTAETEDVKAMFEVQSHLRAAEDKISRLKEDAAKRNPADQMGAEDRAATMRDASKELAGAEKFLGGAKGRLDASKARDYQKRIAAAKKDLAALKGPSTSTAPKK